MLDLYVVQASRECQTHTRARMRIRDTSKVARIANPSRLREALLFSRAPTSAATKCQQLLRNTAMSTRSIPRRRPTTSLFGALVRQVAHHDCRRLGPILQHMLLLQAASSCGVWLGSSSHNTDPLRNVMLQCFTKLGDIRPQGGFGIERQTLDEITVLPSQDTYTNVEARCPTSLQSQAMKARGCPLHNCFAENLCAHNATPR